jgi:hypothetical protein
LFAVAKNRLAKNSKLKGQFTLSRLVPVVGILSALFLLSLGLVYFNGIKEIDGFTKMYREYSALLFYTGSVFLAYSVLTALLRLRSSKCKILK